MIDLAALLGRARALASDFALCPLGSRCLRLAHTGVVAILLGILRRRHNRGRSSIRFLCGGSLCSLNHRMGLCRSGRRAVRIGRAHGQAHSRRRRRVVAPVSAEEAWRARAGHLEAALLVVGCLLRLKEVRTRRSLRRPRAPRAIPGRSRQHGQPALGSLTSGQQPFPSASGPFR